MPKKYTKKSNYWNKFQKQVPQIAEAEEAVEPATMGPAYHISEASSYERGGYTSGLGGKSSTSRINRSAIQNPVNKFSQIRGGLLPFELVELEKDISFCNKLAAEAPKCQLLLNMTKPNFASGTMSLNTLFKRAGSL